MRRLSFFTLVPSLALILVSGPVLADRPAEGAMPLSQLVKSLEDQGYIITEVEYDDDEWEFEGYDAEGEDMEIDVDPMTGDMDVDD